jgi:prolyl oligopeptidase
MRARRTCLIGILLSLAVQAEAQSIRYPVTRKVDTADVYHGTRLTDPYRWLESLDSPDVAEWVKSQNGVTMPYLASLPGRDLFKTRISALYNYARTGIPFFEGGRWFYTKNTGLQRQSVWFSRRTLEGAEEVVIDPNQLSPDGSVALAGFFPSPDGRRFAYGQSEGGSDWTTYYVREFGSATITDTVRWSKFGGPSWTHDGRGFFYSRYPEPVKGRELENKMENHTLYYHRVGTPQSADVRVYARPDQPSWFVFAGVSETGRYLFINTSQGTDKTELYIADLGDPDRPNVSAPIRPVVTGHDANYYALGVAGGRLYMQVDKDAPRRKIVSTSVDSLAPANWRTVIPEGEMPIESASLVAGRIAILALSDVASTIRLHSLDGRFERNMTLPGLGSASPIYGRFDRPEVIYSFTAPLSPSTVHIYNTANNTSRAFNPPKLTFDPSKFITERVFYRSKDGTRVPMFITRRQDLVKNGNNPAMLYAYGGFSVSETPYFRPDVIAWVEQGGIYAVAHIRGGGEYGEAWHQAGMLEKKQNVFDDFIAAGEHLIGERYTSASKLAINGGSNGGLLVGAVMTQRPELFGAAVPQVGVLDMLRYDRFTGGGAWAVEYGASSDPKAFQYLRAYSPLHNIKPGVCYPATLVTTADHDDRVVPSHSFKFTSAMQEVQAAVPGCAKPVLIRVEVQGSHGYRPLDRRIAELADIWAFAAQHTGMSVRPGVITP